MRCASSSILVAGQLLLFVCIIDVFFCPSVVVCSEYVVSEDGGSVSVCVVASHPFPLATDVGISSSSQQRKRLCILRPNSCTL